nr:transmembrane protein 254 [Loxodonta africana]
MCAGGCLRYRVSAEVRSGSEHRYSVPLVLFQWVVFWPQSIPYQNLGPLGSFTQYLVAHHQTLMHNGYWLAWLIHVGESLYAMVLCKYKGISDGRAQLLWFIQTFLFGIASLSILIAYRPKRQKQT